MIPVPEYLIEVHGNTALEQVEHYARACIADPKHNNRKHIWACQRLMDDLKRSGDAACPFYWDETEAQNIVEWFSLLRHSKGVLSGQPIILTPWQRFWLCQLYGWKRKENGRRRVRKSFTQVGIVHDNICIGRRCDRSGAAGYSEQFCRRPDDTVLQAF